MCNIRSILDKYITGGFCMKKLLMLFLVALVCLGAVWAKGGSQGTASGAIKVDVFWYTFGDTYLTSVRNAMQDQLASMPQINATMHDSQNNQAMQTQLIETAITQGTSLLVVNIVTTGSEEAAMNIVGIARRANLPIIFFNREVSNAVISSYDRACFVGTDADEAGYMEGQAIAEFLLKAENWNGNTNKYDLNGDNKISYIMFRGEHGNAEAFGRTKYSVTEANRLLGARGLSLTTSPANQTSTQYDNDGISNYFLYGNWSATEAANLMRTALSAHSLTNGSIELIIANNDDQALGAIEAMNENGFNTGRQGAGYIPVFGVDATTVAVEAIRAGRMTGTILQDAPGMAKTILALAQNVANGQDVFSNTSGYNVDSGVHKIRVPYAIVN
jgi:methyl-galactoside transport system substrate-binding protein